MRLRRVIQHTLFAVLASPFLNLAVEAQTIGTSVASYLQSKLNTRIGSGESSDMAVEALRFSGGEFCADDLGADSPASGDKVWGTLLTQLSIVNGKIVDSNSTNVCLVGDIMQFGGGVKVGNVSYPTQCTTVVQTVNGQSGRPSAIYQQNVGGVRTVKSVNFNVAQFSKGWIRIYRPIARKDYEDTLKFTVVNNSASSQPLKTMYGVTEVSSVTAASANSAGGFFAYKLATDGTVPCIVVNNTTFYIESEKAFEIYDLAGGSIDIRQVSE